MKQLTLTQEQAHATLMSKNYLCGRHLPFNKTTNYVGLLQEMISHKLEYIRTELREERISYSELTELQTLSTYIDPNDVELLEAAGVPENLQS